MLDGIEWVPLLIAVVAVVWLFDIDPIGWFLGLFRSNKVAPDIFEKIRAGSNPLGDFGEVPPPMGKDGFELWLAAARERRGMSGLTAEDVSDAELAGFDRSQNALAEHLGCDPSRIAEMIRFHKDKQRAADLCQQLLSGQIKVDEIRPDYDFYRKLGNALGTSQFNKEALLKHADVMKATVEKWRPTMALAEMIGPAWIEYAKDLRMQQLLAGGEDIPPPIYP